MSAITLTNCSFSYNSSPLITDVSMRIGAGERACLVGPNGCGKSTLLRLMAGKLTPDSGQLAWDGISDVRQHVIPEVIQFSGTVAEYLDSALASLRSSLVRFDEVTVQWAADPNNRAVAREYEELLSYLTAADIWRLDSRIDETLAGLQLKMLMGAGRQRILGTLSAGQRVRLALAALLISRPPILLLDEPTNHLDYAAIDFLCDLLHSWDGPVVMSSHDRDFIERTATVIYDLDIASWQALATARGEGALPGVYACAGGYRDYLAMKSRARSEHQHIHTRQQQQKKHIAAHRHDSEKIARGGVQLANAARKSKKFFSDRAAATAVRRTRNDDRRLEVLSRTEVPKLRGYQLAFPIEAAPPDANLLVSVRQAEVEGRLQQLSFDVAAGEHLLITGSNGSGKSTLLSWIATACPAQEVHTRGTVMSRGAVGFVPQRLPQEDDPGFHPAVWREGIGEIGKGIIHPSLWKMPIADLSDGNQRRAQIAIALMAKPAILVIDEPTNYLDLDTVEALEVALKQWNGALIIASHDRWLIDHWQGRRLHLEPAHTGQ
ncbi:ABC-F family ATP-binding cassette domain-containing protein [Trueperella sp. LYQ141]|uniref:ABC-F family ATP-binding cassette domain-containing protein n=1 Tax=Trueperella sp. LYQ141 TaxID=3391058 RepID=UPI0039837020